MDEIDKIKEIKKVVLLFTKIFGGVGILFLICAISAYLNSTEKEGAMLLIALLIGLGIPAILVSMYITLNIIEKIINPGRKVINFDKNYIREFPKNCSPAIASFIYDLKIDIYRDYTATILYLCIKKYIELEKYGATYKVKLVEDKDISALGRCERYILNIIIGKQSLNEVLFKQEIIREAQEKMLITDKKYSKKGRVLLILIITILLLVFAYKINIYLFAVCSAIILPVLYIYVNGTMYSLMENTEYVRTKKGKELAIILKGLKNFIKEYTLIKDKEIDYIKILEDYIPYAVALEEADAIEEFIKHNEQYRNLIYNRKVDKH